MKQQQTKRTSQGPETTKVCGIKTAGLTTPYCQTLSGTGICRQISCQLIRYTECEGKREAKNSDENDCSYSDPTWVPVGSTTWPATVCYIHCYDACKCHCQKHNEVSKCQHICGSQVAGAKDQLTRSPSTTEVSSKPKTPWTPHRYAVAFTILPFGSFPSPAAAAAATTKGNLFFHFLSFKHECTKPWEKPEESNHHLHNNNKTKMHKTLRKNQK